MASSIALIALCALVLILLLLVIFMRTEICAIKDLCERMRDKWASTENLCRKLDVAITWLIEEKGVMLEQASAWSNSWYISPLRNKYQRDEMEKAFNEVYAHRKEIAQALLDALKQWDEERQANWDKTKKGGKK